MKFYVLTDVHGFYSEMLAALNTKGSFVMPVRINWLSAVTCSIEARRPCSY